MPERTYALYGPLRIPRTGDRKRIATERLDEFRDCDADEVAVAVRLLRLRHPVDGGN